MLVCSSLALAAHLRRMDLGHWELCTGVRQEGSYTLTHAWLERGGVLLDITADQFHAYGLPLRAGPVFLGTDRGWHAQFGSPTGIRLSCSRATFPPSPSPRG